MALCACPVRIMRAEFCVIVSSTWLAKNISAVSMMANNSAKNIGATRANCTTAEPRRLRRNRPSNERSETVEAADDDIGQSWAAALEMKNYRKLIVEALHALMRIGLHC